MQWRKFNTVQTKARLETANPVWFLFANISSAKLCSKKFKKEIIIPIINEKGSTRENFFAFQVSHLYKFDAVLIVYSITDRESFQFAKDVLSEINLKNNTKRPRMKRQLAANEQEIAAAAAGARPRIVILVGNKTDLERSRSVTTKGKAND